MACEASMKALTLEKANADNQGFTARLRIVDVFGPLRLGASPPPLRGQRQWGGPIIVTEERSNIFINLGQGDTNTSSAGGALTQPFICTPNECVPGTKNLSRTTNATGTDTPVLRPRRDHA